MRKFIIILIKEGNYEAYTTLKLLCEEKEFSYLYLRKKHFPIQYKGYTIEKIPINVNNNL